MDGDADGHESGRRIALLLEYDGTAYCGSQYQDNGPSIQAELEAAITKLTGDTGRVSFAGRTDAGVHALGQVAAFGTQSRLSAAETLRGLNHFLPEDIAVLAAKEAGQEFDPRRNARGRLYRYQIVNRGARTAIDRDRAWHIAKPLDIAAMRRAAQALQGWHDFAAFAAPFEGSTERTLRRCDITATDGRVDVEMEAEAFLPHQVRRTVGPLVEVGLGRMTEDELAALLENAVPSSAGPAASPAGLYLVSVTYDGFAFGPEDGNGRSA
jgi:tRNA pseudouridine38-40 synthase